MKKINTILLFLLINIILSCAYSQVKEVKGVETKWITYEGKQYNESFTTKPTYYNTYYGYEFANKNNFQITIEMELWEKPCYDNNDRATLITTKSFVLDAKEIYVYKSSGRSFQTVSTYYRFEPASSHYYVKFKAFKNEE